MPLVIITLAWLTGIFLQAQLPLPLPALAAVAVLGPAAGIVLRRRRDPGLKPRVMLAGAAVCALALGALRYQAAQPAIDGHAPAAYNDQGTVTLEGVVADEPAVSDARVLLRVRVETLKPDGPAPRRAVAGLVLVQAPRYPEYAYGDRLRVRGELLTPPESDDFSYKEYLARQGVYSLMQRPQIERVANGQGAPLMAALLAAKARMRTAVAGLLPEPEASVLTGILIGDDNGIPADLAAAFSATGTTHVLAISGFNVTIIAGVLMALAKRTVGERLGAPLAILALLVYTVFVGASASVVRATIMGILIILAQRLGRDTFALNSLALAALVMTALNPLTLWDAGFVLSAGATLGLVLYVEPLTALCRSALLRVLPESAAERVLAVIGDGLIVTTAAQITTTAYIVYTFRRLSIITLPVNFLVLPVQPPLMLWGGAAALAALVWRPAGQVLAAVSWVFITWTVRVVEAGAAVPGASAGFDYVPPAWVWAYYALLFGLTALPERGRAWLKEHLRATSVLLALVVGAVLLWTAVPLLPDGRLHVTMLNVEDGSAVLIQTPEGRRILVDGGPRASTLLSQVGRRLSWWDRRIDVVVLSNPKPTRLAGLVGVLERYDVGYMLTNGEDDTPTWAALTEALAARGIAHGAALAGGRIDTGDGVVVTLYNAAPANAERFADDQSLVVRVTYGDVSFVLPSDITEEGELTLLRTVPPATVLLAARNGTAEATGEAWLRALAPSAVAISVRPGERAFSPDPQVLRRLGALPVWRTDEHGGVEWATDGAGVWVAGER
jgi:competence protein ComEC